MVNILDSVDHTVLFITLSYAAVVGKHTLSTSAVCSSKTLFSNTNDQLVDLLPTFAFNYFIPDVLFIYFIAIIDYKNIGPLVHYYIPSNSQYTLTDSKCSVSVHSFMLSGIDKMERVQYASDLEMLCCYLMSSFVSLTRSAENPQSQ